MKTINAKVSVIITTFNYGKYVSEAIDSAIRQTYRNLEIIVVDDGSTDDTEEVVRPYIDKNLIKYVRIKNSGQAVAKNTGILNSSSDYVAFLDADDNWDRTKLENQMPHFSDSDVGVVYCSAIDIDCNGDVMPKAPITNKYLLPKSGQVMKQIIFDNFVPFSSAVIKKQCFEKMGMFDESLKMGIDWDLWLRFSLSYKFIFVDKPLLFYRVGHSGQMSKNLEERQRCSDRIMSKFLSNYSGLISPLTIRKVHAFTYCNRGEYYRKSDNRKSFLCFIRALGSYPVFLPAYKGLVKILCAYR